MICLLLILEVIQVLLIHLHKKEWQVCASCCIKLKLLCHHVHVASVDIDSSFKDNTTSGIGNNINNKGTASYSQAPSVANDASVAHDSSKSFIFYFPTNHIHTCRFTAATAHLYYDNCIHTCIHFS